MTNIDAALEFADKTCRSDSLAGILSAEVRRLRDENERLRNQILLVLSALKDAREMVEDWGSYASPYFQGKHDFTGDLTKLDSAIDAVRGV